MSLPLRWSGILYWATVAASNDVYILFSRRILIARSTAARDKRTTEVANVIRVCRNKRDIYNVAVVLLGSLSLIIIQSLLFSIHNIANPTHPVRLRPRSRGVGMQSVRRPLFHIFLAVAALLTRLCV